MTIELSEAEREQLSRVDVDDYSPQKCPMSKWEAEVLNNLRYKVLGALGGSRSLDDRAKDAMLDWLKGDRNQGPEGSDDVPKDPAGANGPSPSHGHTDGGCED